MWMQHGYNMDGNLAERSIKPVGTAAEQLVPRADEQRCRQKQRKPRHPLLMKQENIEHS